MKPGDEDREGDQNLELSTDDITLQDLHRYLLKCADIIRNTVDKTDYKDYILPLVFYKSISDTFQDRYEEKLDEFDDEELARDPAFQAFQIPKGYAFSDALQQNKNVDQFLNEAFDEIEQANPDTLAGVFRADFVEAEALDTPRLKRLLAHLDKYNLSVERIPTDMLGEGYMDLVKHFASEEGRDGGEFFTPPRIVRLMVRLLAPFEKGDTFHDPTAGSGGMLVTAARHFRDEQGMGDAVDSLKLTAQELNPDIYAICKMNLLLHSLNGEIRRGDSLGNPQFTETENELETFDYVLANFPFSDEWAKEEFKEDPYRRFDWADKLPSADRADFAYIMHMVAQLAKSGELAVVIPQGVLFRKNEQPFRKHLIEEDLVKAIIGLPEKLFQNGNVKPAILLLDKEKPKRYRDSVLFVNGVQDGFYEDLGDVERLTDEGINEIVSTFVEAATKKRFSRMVSLSEIRENNFYLNIPLYVETADPPQATDVATGFQEFNDLRDQRQYHEDILQSQVQSLLKSGRYTGEKEETPVGKLPPDWTVNRIGDEENITVNPEGVSLEEWDKDSFEYLTLGGVSKGHVDDYDIVPVDQAPSRAKRRIRAKDILVGTVRPKQFSHAMVPNSLDGAVCSSGFGVLRTTVDLNPHYLMQEILSHRFYRQMEAWSAGSGYPAIGIGDLKRHRIAIPPKQGQDKIGNILHNLDKAIEKNRRTVEALESLKGALLESLLAGDYRTSELEIP